MVHKHDEGKNRVSDEVVVLLIKRNVVSKSKLAWVTKRTPRALC